MKKIYRKGFEPRDYLLPLEIHEHGYCTSVNLYHNTIDIELENIVNWIEQNLKFKWNLSYYWLENPDKLSYTDNYATRTLNFENEMDYNMFKTWYILSQ